jgi:hypothetical protein
MELNFGNMLKGAGRQLYESTPFDNVANMTRAAVAGNWGEAAKQLGYGAFDTALWMVPGGAAVRGAAGAGKLGLRAAAKQLGTKQAGKLFLRGAIAPGNKALVPGLNKATRFGLGFYGPMGVKGLAATQLLNPVLGEVAKNPTGAQLLSAGMNAASPIFSTVGNIPVVGDAASLAWKLAMKDIMPEATTNSSAVNMAYGANASAPTSTSTPSSGYGTSAAEVRRKEEDDKRKAAEGAYDSGIAAAQKDNIPPINVPQAPGGLQPLTPEQMQMMLEQERALQREYDNLLNQLSLSEKQGNLDAVSSRYGIQREASGSAVDMASKLAMLGMDESPASAIGAEQMVQGRRTSQEASVAKNLADLIAQIQQQRVQAGSSKDLGLLRLKQQADQNRISNTRDYLYNQYENYGGA